ncbi:MAG: hypothetical protein V4539_04120 [Bacteroidota bacterium]
MKQTILILFVVCSFMACRKTNIVEQNTTSLSAQKIIKDSLSPALFNSIDFSKTSSHVLQNGKSLYRFPLTDANNHYVIVITDQNGKYVNAKIIAVSGSFDLTSKNKTYNGTITTSFLNGAVSKEISIVNGLITSLHQVSNVQSNGLKQHPLFECADCTLPEVIVSSSYNSGGGIDWASWMSLLDLLGYDDDYGYYYSFDYFGGGGGSSGGGSGDVTTIDREYPENKTAIDPKKFMDCFGTIPDAGATCSITIATDLPVDGHPETFFNWNEQSPGHSFIELNKSTPYGGVSQDIGFYPNTSLKSLTGDYIAAKVVDNGGHEYQAKYTITVTPAQFQAAIDKVNSSSYKQYNLEFYNCTDFALDIFNAAGGNLDIPRHKIPNYEIDGGSNTPQGLYEKIAQLKSNGVAGTTTTQNKEYAGSSKGPCN